MIVLFFSILGIHFISVADKPYQKEQEWFEYRCNYDLEMMKKSSSQFENTYLHQLITSEMNYLIEGKPYFLEKKALSQDENPLAVLLYVKLQGRNAKEYNKVLHQTLLEQLDRLRKAGAPYWENQFHRAIVTYILPFSIDQVHLYPLIENHLSAINGDQLSTIDQYRYYELKVDLMSQQLFFNAATFNTVTELKDLLEAFSKIRVREPYLKGIQEQGWGIYHEVFTKQIDQALIHFRKASSLFDQTDFWIGKQAKVLNDHSLGILLYNAGNYTEALPLFQRGLNEKAIQENPEGLLRTNEYLSKCYEGLGDSKRALQYFKEARKHLDSLNRLEQTKEILKMSLTHDIEKKQKELEQLTQKHTSLSTQFQTLLPLSGGLLLLVIFFIWLYRKAQFKKQHLEIEKEDTLKEVQALKQLLIKNHIVLKDKTKIYISDLLYVRAEDHYIRVFTSNGKNHLVRGRLTDLDEQLPPNFVRTHRSYITNRNFVKQIQRNFFLLTDGTEIPISRKFQKDWT
ncbi:MAG: LytTR family transcriptional regulator DNA-binding domain-containing protein [Flavobacteriaceae bacterium]